MGRETFERALADPESLADMGYNAEQAHFEGYQYVACKVFMALSGADEFPRSRSHPKEPTGYDWPENKVGELYPNLAAKYGYKD